eukprot:scpid64013/ scgid7251/ 
MPACRSVLGSGLSHIAVTLVILPSLEMRPVEQQLLALTGFAGVGRVQQIHAGSWRLPFQHQFRSPGSEANAYFAVKTRRRDQYQLQQTFSATHLLHSSPTSCPETFHQPKDSPF